ncbi:MAG: hypothetical protein WAM91_02925 [Candidatus Acidiferrales bacterium]
MAGLLSRAGPHCAIVNREFFKIGENRDREFGAPSVPAKLKRWGGVGTNIYAALFGFGIKLRHRADTECVVWSFLLSLNIQAIFGNHFAILRRDHRRVANVPAESFKERVDQGLADVGLFDAGSEECLTVGCEVPA